MKLPRYNPALLPWVGAASQAVLYTFAGVQAYGNWGAIIGPGVGITASLAVATAATSTGGSMSKYRRSLTNAGIVIMVLVSPAVIALSIAVPDSFWTAIAWGAAVDVSIVLAGAVAGNRMVATETKPKPEGQPATETPKPTKKPVKVDRQPVTDEQLLSFFAGNPGATDTDAAERFGETRQAIGKRVSKLYGAKK